MNRGKRVFATNNDFQSRRFESALHVNTSFTLHFRPSHCINTFHRKGNFAWSRRTVHEMIQFASAGSILWRRTERFLRYNETSLESKVSRTVSNGVRRQAHVRGYTTRLDDCHQVSTLVLKGSIRTGCRWPLLERAFQFPFSLCASNSGIFAIHHANDIVAAS